MFKTFLKFFIISCAILVFLGSAQAAPIPSISLNLLNSDIYVGDSFDVQVLVDGDGIALDLLSFGFDVNTTGGVFSYDSYMIESGFDDDSMFIPPEVAGSAFPAIANDDVLLATLSFMAIDPGTGALQVLGLTDFLFFGLAYEINAIDIGWYDIDTTLNLDIKSVPNTKVPAPSAVFLFGSGLAGLIGFNRKLRKKG